MAFTRRKRMANRSQQPAQVNGLYVHASPPRVVQMNPSIMRQWLRGGDLDKLEQVVLEGQGNRLLGEYSADPKTRAFIRSVPSLLTKIEAAHAATVRGQLKELQDLIAGEKRIQLALAKDRSGVGLLHKALFQDHGNIVEWLIQAYPATVNSKDREGRSPLHYCGAGSDAQFTWRTLIEAGADPQQADVRGRVPAYYMDNPDDLRLPASPADSEEIRRITAAREGLIVKPSNIRIWIHDQDLGRLKQVLWEGHGNRLRTETSKYPAVKRFLDFVPYAMNAIRDTHAAAISGDREAFRNRTAEPVPVELIFSKDSNGLTPLHKSAGLGNIGVTEEILQRAPRSTAVTDNFGRTPLHYSVLLKDQGGMYNMLIREGADELAVDNFGRTAEYYRGRPAGDLDASLLRNIPEAPRTSLVFPPSWDWSVLATDGSISNQTSGASRHQKKTPRASGAARSDGGGGSPLDEAPATNGPGPVNGEAGADEDRPKTSDNDVVNSSEIQPEDSTEDYPEGNGRLDSQTSSAADGVLEEQQARIMTELFPEFRTFLRRLSDLEEIYERASLDRARSPNVQINRSYSGNDSMRPRARGVEGESRLTMPDIRVNSPVASDPIFESWMGTVNGEKIGGRLSLDDGFLDDSKLLDESEQRGRPLSGKQRGRNAAAKPSDIGNSAELKSSDDVSFDRETPLSLNNSISLENSIRDNSVDSVQNREESFATENSAPRHQRFEAGAHIQLELRDFEQPAIRQSDRQDIISEDRELDRSDLISEVKVSKHVTLRAITKQLGQTGNQLRLSDVVTRSKDQENRDIGEQFSTESRIGNTEVVSGFVNGLPNGVVVVDAEGMKPNSEKEPLRSDRVSEEGIQRDDHTTQDIQRLSATISRTEDNVDGHITQEIRTAGTLVILMDADNNEVLQSSESMEEAEATAIQPSENLFKNVDNTSVSINEQHKTDLTSVRDFLNKRGELLKEGEISVNGKTLSGPIVSNPSLEQSPGPTQGRNKHDSAQDSDFTLTDRTGADFAVDKLTELSTDIFTDTKSSIDKQQDLTRVIPSLASPSLEDKNKGPFLNTLPESAGQPANLSNDSPSTNKFRIQEESTDGLQADRLSSGTGSNDDEIKGITLFETQNEAFGLIDESIGGHGNHNDTFLADSLSLAVNEPMKNEVDSRRMTGALRQATVDASSKIGNSINLSAVIEQTEQDGLATNSSVPVSVVFSTEQDEKDRAELSIVENGRNEMSGTADETKILPGENDIIFGQAADTTNTIHRDTEEDKRDEDQKTNVFNMRKSTDELDMVDDQTEKFVRVVSGRESDFDLVKVQTSQLQSAVEETESAGRVEEETQEEKTSIGEPPQIEDGDSETASVELPDEISPRSGSQSQLELVGNKLDADVLPTPTNTGEPTNDTDGTANGSGETKQPAESNNVAERPISAKEKQENVKSEEDPDERDELSENVEKRDKRSVDDNTIQENSNTVNVSEGFPSTEDVPSAEYIAADVEVPKPEDDSPPQNISEIQEILTNEVSANDAPTTDSIASAGEIPTTDGASPGEMDGLSQDFADGIISSVPQDDPNSITTMDTINIPSVVVDPGSADENQDDDPGEMGAAAEGSEPDGEVDMSSSGTKIPNGDVKRGEEKDVEENSNDVAHQEVEDIDSNPAEDEPQTMESSGNGDDAQSDSNANADNNNQDFKDVGDDNKNVQDSKEEINEDPKGDGDHNNNDVEELDKEVPGTPDSSDVVSGDRSAESISKDEDSLPDENEEGASNPAHGEDPSCREHDAGAGRDPDMGNDTTQNPSIDVGNGPQPTAEGNSGEADGSLEKSEPPNEARNSLEKNAEGDSNEVTDSEGNPGLKNTVKASAVEVAEAVASARKVAETNADFGAGVATGDDASESSIRGEDDSTVAPPEVSTPEMVQPEPVGTKAILPDVAPPIADLPEATQLEVVPPAEAHVQAPSEVVPPEATQSEVVQREEAQRVQVPEVEAQQVEASAEEALPEETLPEETLSKETRSKETLPEEVLPKDGRRKVDMGDASVGVASNAEEAPHKGDFEDTNEVLNEISEKERKLEDGNTSKGEGLSNATTAIIGAQSTPDTINTDDFQESDSRLYRSSRRPQTPLPVASTVLPEEDEDEDEGGMGDEEEHSNRNALVYHLQGRVIGERNMDNQAAASNIGKGGVNGGAAGHGTSGLPKPDPEVDRLIARGDLSALAELVLNGEGHRLVGRRSEMPELQSFIENVPTYMAKIQSVHDSARSGQLRELQAALDRRKFAVARDPRTAAGATPLHVAVLLGQTAVVRYLAGRFPETLAARDARGRAPLHCAAGLPDNGHYFNLLLNLGADRTLKDNNGRIASYYMQNPGVLSHKQLLSDINAPQRIADETFADKVPDDKVSSRRRVVNDPELASTMDKYFQVIEEAAVDARADNRPVCRMVVLKFLTRNVFDQCKYLLTRMDHGILNVIWPVILDQSRSVEDRLKQSGTFFEEAGIVLPDYESYSVFSVIVLPVVKYLNGLDPRQPILPHPPSQFFEDTDDEVSSSGTTLSVFSRMELRNDEAAQRSMDLDPSRRKILHCVAHCTRNLEDYNLPQSLTIEELREVERYLRRALLTGKSPYQTKESGQESDDFVLSDDEGTYYPLEELSDPLHDIRVKLRSAGQWLEQQGDPDRSMRLHGKYWPLGRGVFVTKDGSIAAYINVQDHLRVLIASQEGQAGKIGLAYRNLGEFMENVDSIFKFKQDDIVGYLAARPWVCGNSLRFKVTVRLPKLGREPEHLITLCKTRCLRVASAASLDVFHLSNRQCLGITEAQVYRSFVTAVANILQLEHTMEANGLHFSTIIRKIFRKKHVQANRVR